MRRENQALRMEREILKKPRPSSPGRPTSRRRCVPVCRGAEGQLPDRVDVPGARHNRTSFHDWERRAPSDRTLSDAWLTAKIKQIHHQNWGVYGALRIHAELRIEHNIRVGESASRG